MFSLSLNILLLIVCFGLISMIGIGLVVTILIISEKIIMGTWRK